MFPLGSQDSRGEKILKEVNTYHNAFGLHMGMRCRESETGTEQTFESIYSFVE
jgi:hypothetical protein